MVEIVIHVVRDCPRAIEVWCSLVKPDRRSCFFFSNLQDWIVDNFHNGYGWDPNGEWTNVWATTCYFLWMWRNKGMHDDEFSRSAQPWRVISHNISNYKHVVASEIHHQQRDFKWITVRWEADAPGWITLNTDGASKEDMSLAGCGVFLKVSAVAVLL